MYDFTADTRKYMMVCTVLFARMTVLIYHDEPYIHDFDATVISVQDGWIELDRTAFYPGGGGRSRIVAP